MRHRNLSVPQPIATPLAWALETRTMFDAAAGATNNEAQNQADSAPPPPPANTPDPVPPAVAAGGTEPANPGLNVVFVDSRIRDHQTVVDAVAPGSLVVVLAADRDGLAQIAEWAQGRHGTVTSMHIISHGEAGRLHLGTANVTTAGLDAYSADLASIGQALTVNGDLLLYGCNLAADVGQTFIERLATLTGADVAASTDTTGATALGGNWTLEASVGLIETNALTIDGYRDLLATVTFSGDTGTVTNATVATAGIPSTIFTIDQTIGSDTLRAVSTGTGMYLDTDANIQQTTTGTSGKYLATDTNQFATQVEFTVTGSKTFDFNTISVYENLGNNTTFRFTSSKSGQVDVNFTGNTSQTVSLTSDTNFQGVSWVRVTATTNSGNFGVVFDNIVLDNITAPNTAPTLTNASVNLTTAFGSPNEDQTTSGVNVTTILGNFTSSDADGGALAGIAITGVTGSGWEYTTNSGTTWTAVGTVSNTSALLLRSATTDQLRYVGDNNNGVAADFTFRRWDQTSGTFGNKVTTATNGGASAFSSNTATGTLTVTAVNDAPTITSAPTSVSFTEDTAGNLNLSAATLADVDAGSNNVTLTIAATAGTMASSSGGGVTIGGSGTGTITLTGTVSAIDTFLNTASNITYTGASNANGTNAATLTLTLSDLGNTGSGGTLTATTNVQVDITAVNDAPVIAGGVATAAYTEQVSSAYIFANNIAITDPDHSGTAGSFNGAVATISFGTYQTGDTISVANVNNVVYTSGAPGTVTFNSVQIGTTTGGSAANFVITFNSSATAAGVNAVLNSVVFFNSANDNPTATGTATTRAVSLTFADGGISGSGGTQTSAALTGNLNVTAVNDAPTIATAPTTVTFTEDTAGNLDLSAATLADVDSGSANVTLTVAATAGTMTASSGGGVTVANSGTGTITLTGTVTAIDTFLNTATNIQYTGAANAAGTNAATITLTLSDGGNTGTGGTLTATSNVQVDITAVNDAPTLTNATVALTTTFGSPTENDVTSGVTVSTILGSYTSGDVDAGALSGIAITARTANGTWQYSINGGTNWTSFGTVSGSQALLLRSTDQVRFLGDAANGETATFTFRRWDQTTGTEGTKVDASTNGNATAFSNTTAVAQLVTTSLNDAPTLTNATVAVTTSFSSPNEDQTTAGVNVSTILGNFTSGDVDTGANSGIAITGTTASGTWQYSTDAGANWNAVGTVSASSALLLRSTDQMRFIGNSSNGETATFTFRRWDQTTGTQGTTVDTSTNGGTTAFSTNTAIAQLVVTSVNDAPTLSGGPYTFTGVNSAAANSTAATVSTILGGATYADVDTGAASGIAITAVSGAGTWQYTTDGTTWNSVGSVSATSARLLAAANQVRYVPVNGTAETATFTYRAWDTTSGTAGGTANVSTNGTTTAFSSGTAQGSIGVTVNATPVLGGATAGQTANDTGTVSPFSGFTITDAENNNVTVTVQLDTAAKGAFTAASLTASGFTDAGGGQYTLASSTTAAAQTAIRALVFDPTDNRVASGSTETTTFTVSVSDGTTTGTNNTTTVVSTSINDAPTLTNATVAVTTSFGSPNEDQTTAGVAVSTILGNFTSGDVDASANGGIAITGVTGNGTWQYTTNGGTTWSAMGTVAADFARLLRSTDQMRFVGDSSNGETATFTFRRWDQTSGTAGNREDASINGGTTAFSNTTATGQLVVTSVNDAPTLTNAAVALTGVFGVPNEDTTTSGVNVSTILGNFTSSDVDTGASSGIAIIATTANGAWQYTTDGGATWTAVGTVSTTSALLLRNTDQMRFVGNNNNGETATFSFRRWDQTSGTQGTKVDASFGAIGDTTALSNNTAIAQLVVTSVNDAPTLTNATVDLTTRFGSRSEDQTSTALNVSTLLGDFTSGDVDSSASAGIAITGATGTGTWQYTFNGGTNWFSVGTVSDSGALLLRSTSSDQLRYVGNNNNGETATLTFRRWDQTSGTVGGKVNASTNGGDTAFSSTTATGQYVVTSVNDAPTLTNATVALTTAFGSPNEDQTTSAVNVSTILGNYTSGDVDTGALSGIAITGTTANGAWQYTTDGGTTWTAVGTVSGTSALLLRSTDQMRFVGDNNNGETANFTFRRWDQTTGTQGNKVDVSTNGTTTAFSANTATGSLVVTSVNDAPTLTNATSSTTAGALAFGSPDENQTSSSSTVNNFLGSFFNSTDVDTGAVSGVAITATVANGAWQYSTDGGTTWTAVGAVSGTSALLLRSTDRMRFVGDTANGETASFTFRRWDQTSGTFGNKVDASTNGGTTAFSANTATLRMDVTSVNDAPTIGGVTASTTSNTASVLPFANATIADVDTGATQNVTITLANTANGTFTAASVTAAGFTDGGNGTFTRNGVTAAVAQAAIRQLVFQPAGVPAGSTATVGITLAVNDGTTTTTSTAGSVTMTAPPVQTISTNITQQSAPPPPPPPPQTQSAPPPPPPPPPPVSDFVAPVVTVGGALGQTTGQFISGNVAAAIFAGGQGTGGGTTVGGIETGGGVVSANQGSAPQSGISANFADSRNLGSVVSTLTGPTRVGNTRFVESFVRTGNVNTEMRVINEGSNGRPVPAYRIGISPELVITSLPSTDPLAVALASANPIRIETSGPIRVEGAGIETAMPVASLQAQLAAAASTFDADAARLADALSAAFEN